MLIDTHAHVYSDHFEDDRDETIRRALESGVKKILLPNIDSTSIASMLLLSQNYPSICFPMIGLHPCSVNEQYKEELEIVKDWLSKDKFIAIGEIGTDLYWDKTYWKEQQIAFNMQCEWALEHDLPIVIHCRESIDENIALVEPFAKKGIRGVFHCFTGSIDQANRLTQMGFYLGIGGVVTFKNGGIREILNQIDLNYLLLETDSPYLAPTPHRGKRNEPTYTHLIATVVAETLSLSLEEIAGVTSANANQLFRLT